MPHAHFPEIFFTAESNALKSEKGSTTLLYHILLIVP